MPPKAARRPINLKEARKPVVQKEERVENVRSMHPSPEIVSRVARFMLPVTPEEVLFREAGESPILGALSSAAMMGTVGFVGGSIGYFVMNEPPYAVASMCRAGLKSSVQLGLEVGISDLIANSLGQWRGRAKVYDRVIAGACAGAVLGIPNGKKGMVSGATKGAALAAGLALLQAAQRGFDTL